MKAVFLWAYNALLTWGAVLKAYLYTHVRGNIVLLGMATGACLTVGAGVAGASRKWGIAITLLLMGIAIFKPTLLYLVAWTEARAQRQTSRSTGPSEGPKDG